MIEKYKIAKAARQISEYVVDAKGFDDSKPTHIEFLEGHVDGFNAGAKWAINEFLKDLLHPAEEIPEKERPVLVVYKHGGYSIEYWEPYNISGQVNYWTLDITQWLYVDDLFPKEGGGEQ